MTRWRRRRACFHHDRLTGRSYITGQLINMGTQKMFTCDPELGGCGKLWFV